MKLISKLKKQHERRAIYYYRTTVDLEDINKAVHAGTRDSSEVLWNPMLSWEQYHYLMLNPTDSLDLQFLVQQPGFPSDLLHILASTTKNRFLIKAILENPNTLPESKVVISLRGIKPAEIIAKVTRYT